MLLGLILVVVIVQSERLRRALRAMPSAPASTVAPVIAPSPGLSAHCGHTHPTLVTDAQGLTACPACAGRRG